MGRDRSERGKERLRERGREAGKGREEEREEFREGVVGRERRTKGEGYGEEGMEGAGDGQEGRGSLGLKERHGVGGRVGEREVEEDR